MSPKEILKNNQKNILITAVVAILLLLFYRCPLRFLFGLSCPGCGMTRAFEALLKLDFAGAFHCHPLFPFVILVGIYLVLQFLNIFSLPKKTENLLLIIIGILFLLVYLVRMFGGSDIVTFDFTKGIIYKTMQRF